MKCPRASELETGEVGSGVEWILTVVLVFRNDGFMYLYEAPAVFVPFVLFPKVSFTVKRIVFLSGYTCILSWE